MMKMLTKDSSFYLTLSAALIVISLVLSAEHQNRDNLNETMHKAKVQDAPDNPTVYYANCLWYAARNHGFFWVQKQIATGQHDLHTLELWEDFIESTGEAECGPVPASMTKLSLAVNATMSDADQFFLNLHKP